MSRKELAQMYRTHFGKIFFNLSIVGLVSMFIINVAPIFIVFLVWFMMVLIGMLSLFILFFNEGYMNFFNQMTETLKGLTSGALTNVTIALGVVALVSSVLSFVVWLTNKDSERKSRVIASLAVLCLTVVTLIVILIRGGAQ